MDKEDINLAARIGRRIEYALVIRGTTAAELARKTGISQQDISNYRHGRYSPRQDKLFKISTALGVSPAWLMGYETDMYIKDELHYLWERMNENERERAIDYMRYLVARGDDEEKG